MEMKRRASFGPPAAALPSRNENHSSFLPRAPLQNERQLYHPEVPSILRGLLDPHTFSIPTIAPRVVPSLDPVSASHDPNLEDKLRALFPTNFGQPAMEFSKPDAASPPLKSSSLRIGVVLSGGQAPGGHNVICGISDVLQSSCNADSQLLGFLDGPIGLMKGKYIELKPEYVNIFRNQGGFHMIGSGRDKIETPEQFAAARDVCEKLCLDGVVIIGGDDSNTNAAVLSEYLKSSGSSTRVIGCPKTIDGDLKTPMIETSFGFDTACKVYSEQISNLHSDALSSGKYYHFMRLMGRAASHITLECALQTHPNIALIGEEVAAKGSTLALITQQICDVICARASNNKHYGSVLVPEGLIEFIPEVGQLIKELNDIMATGVQSSDIPAILAVLTPASAAVFQFLPVAVRQQLLLDRDSHGNVQVSKIETENLLIQLCETELAQRRRAGTFKGNFSALSHFFGYEGRSGLPSDFDCNYCYTLGIIAVALLQRGCNGLMSCARGLDKPVQQWVCCGIPLTSLMAIERRKGRDVPVIRKALVELSALPFKKFVEHRYSWGLDDAYRFVGPIQFFGAFATETTLTLQLERAAALTGEDQEARVKTVMSNILEKMPGIQGERMAASLSVPDSLKGGVTLSSRVISSNHGGRELPMVELNASGPLERRDSPLKIAVVFCGRQTPGVSNVVAGLYNYIRSRHEHSVLLGARNGTVGFMAGDLVTVDPELLSSFVNRGGFDMLGRSFDMIRTPQQLDAAANICRQQQLQGLVLVGGPVTVADGHKLQLYLKEKEIPTGVIVVPASIDNDLKSVNVEVMLGFDSACKEYTPPPPALSFCNNLNMYTHLIGNVMMDACSAKKYWFFVRVMGRTSGHVALECALSTHPNVVLLGEEVKAKHLSLASIVSQIADSVCVRHNKGHDYGVVVIPEGLASSVPELSILLHEIDTLQKAGSDPLNGLSSWSKAVLLSLPDFIQKQLMLQFEAQGTPQLSRIEMERLLAALVGVELKKRKSLGTYTGSFSSITHFFGYQGRCALPSLFDCNLGFALGAAAAALVSGGCSDMLATANGVVGPVNNWTMAGISLDTFLSPDSSSPPHIGVSVSSRSFKTMQSLKDDWAVGDEYSCPGPMQFHGSSAALIPHTLSADFGSNYEASVRIADLCAKIVSACSPSSKDQVITTASFHLQMLQELLEKLAQQ